MNKHSFSITEDDIILLNGIELPQRNVFEFLESQRIQLANQEKENAVLIANMDEMLYDLLESNPIMSVYWRKKTLHLRVKEGGQG